MAKVGPLRRTGRRFALDSVRAEANRLDFEFQELRAELAKVQELYLKRLERINAKVKKLVDERQQLQSRLSELINDEAGDEL